MSSLRRALAGIVLCGVLFGVAAAPPMPRQVCGLGAQAGRLIAAYRTGEAAAICHSANFG